MLLDDPLSALDATVAQEVYRNAVAGVLSNTCAKSPFTWHLNMIVRVTFYTLRVESTIKASVL